MPKAKAFYSKHFHKSSTNSYYPQPSYYLSNNHSQKHSSSIQLQVKYSTKAHKLHSNAKNQFFSVLYYKALSEPNKKAFVGKKHCFGESLLCFEDLNIFIKYVCLAKLCLNCIRAWFGQAKCKIGFGGGVGSEKVAKLSCLDEGWVGWESCKLGILFALGEIENFKRTFYFYFY